MTFNGSEGKKDLVNKRQTFICINRIIFKHFVQQCPGIYIFDILYTTGLSTG